MPLTLWLSQALWHVEDYNLLMILLQTNKACWHCRAAKKTLKKVKLQVGQVHKNRHRAEHFTSFLCFSVRLSPFWFAFVLSIFIYAYLFYLFPLLLFWQAIGFPRQGNLNHRIGDRGTSLKRVSTDMRSLTHW